MSRDFIGSSVGRSFLKSPNRDRVTNGLIFWPSVTYMKTRFGGTDWCLAYFTNRSLQPHSGTRYRKIRYEFEWTEIPGTIVYPRRPAGKRIDNVYFGGGLTEPTHEIERADAPYQNLWPSFRTTRLIIDETATSSKYVTPTGETHTYTLEDPDPETAENHLATLRQELSAMPFQHLIARGVDAAYWTEGPITFAASEEDGFYRVIRNVGEILPNFMHTLGTAKKFIGLGIGTFNMGLPPTVPFQLGASLNANVLFPGAIAIGGGRVAGEIPLPAGTVPVGTNYGPYGFFYLGSKVLIGRSTALVQGLVSRSIARPSTGDQQFELGMSDLPGGVLFPPSEQIATDYYRYRYARYAIPPSTQL